MSRDDIAKFADGLPDSFLYCREIRHKWDPFDATYDSQLNTYIRIFKCGRCSAKKEQRLTLRGDIVSSKYIYPGNYLSHGLGRIVGDDLSELRLQSIKRYMKGK